MEKSLNRAILGFVAAVISVLVFHQGMWELLHLFGIMPRPYPTDGVPPFGVPRIVNPCFWGGMWRGSEGPKGPFSWVRFTSVLIRRGARKQIDPTSAFPLSVFQPQAGFRDVE